MYKGNKFILMLCTMDVFVTNNPLTCDMTEFSVHALNRQDHSYMMLEQSGETKNNKISGHTDIKDIMLEIILK